MLSPYRVLDLTTERGLICGQILADLGADVVCVEPPGGSMARRIGPFYQDEPHLDSSLFWWAYSRNKRSMTLDLTRSDGQALLRRLAADAHFLLESDHPGILATYGLAYDDLAAINPGLIYVSITPFGQDGPKASYADSDLIVLAAGGPLVLTGDDDRPPVRVGVPQAYLHAGADAAVAALIAHHERQRSGQGQHIDVSAQQSVTQATFSGLLAAPLNSDAWERLSGGVKVGSLLVRLVWPAADGYVTIGFSFGPSIGPFTRRLMEWIYAEGGCDDATRDKDWIAYFELLLSGQEPMSEYERLKQVVEAFTKQRTKAELLQGALERNLLIGPIATLDEVAENEHFIAREYWRTFGHPELGRAFRYPGPFAKFSATPIAYRRRPPTVGEHNRAIYLDELGLSEGAFELLQTRGVI
jgi:crotonobetainyl-CoA:carnitine CoA-transferase CaiB-like acyl-CoA transferase